MTPSLEKKLAIILDNLEGEVRSGALHRKQDIQGIDYLLMDPEVTQWMDDLNRRGVITRGVYMTGHGNR